MGITQVVRMQISHTGEPICFDPLSLSRCHSVKEDNSISGLIQVSGSMSVAIQGLIFIQPFYTPSPHI